MRKSPVSILYDSEGNPIEVRQDGDRRILAVNDPTVIMLLERILEQLEKQTELIIAIGEIDFD